MDRRRFLQTMVGATGAVVLGACSADDRSGDKDALPAGSSGTAAESGRPTLRLPGGNFGLPSPFGYRAGPGYRQMSLVYDTLLWTDSSGSLIPWLASRYERSADGLSYTFELREVHWTDGRPLTARDVAFTFEYFGSQTLSPLVIAQPRYVVGVTTTGRRTVQIRLERPAVTFLRAVAATVPIVPEHVWSSIADAQTAPEEALVSTGPYRLKSRSAEEGSTLFVANDRFFVGKPFVRRIELVSVADELNGLLAGDIDGGSPAVEGVTPDALAPFRGNDKFGLISHPTGFAFPMYFNLGRGGPLADVRFRRAVAMAIDRGDIVRRLLKGNGAPGSAGFLPPGHPFHTDVEPYSFDLAGANRLLDQAGYPMPSQAEVRRASDGTPLQFTIVQPNSVPPALSEILVSQFKAIGVGLSVEVFDHGRLFGAKSSGNFDLVVTPFPGPVGTGIGSDPDILRSIFSSRGAAEALHHATGYVNPRVDDLLEQQLTAADENERKVLVDEIQRAVAGDLPVLTLYYTTLFFAFRRQAFDQWYFTPGGYGPGLPTVYNKHAFVTGAKRGLKVRQPG